MANAQILLIARGRDAVSAESFQAIVGEAIRSAGYTPGQWTYDVTRAVADSSGGSTPRETIVGGPWDGLTSDVTSGGLPAGRHNVVISSFRQVVAGETTDARLQQALDAIPRTIPASDGSTAVLVRRAVGTLARAISFDRGIPGPVNLSVGGAGSGIGWGVLTAIGLFGLYVAKGR